MWYLLLENISGPPTLHSANQKWALIPNEVYMVGRTSNCNISLPGDTSVNQTHAKIQVFTKADAKPGEPPSIILEDLVSTYGTHINDNILHPKTYTASEASEILKIRKETGRVLSKPLELKDNDRIRFGTGHSICRLRWLKLEVISSMLKDPSSVNKWLKEIDNTKIQPRWSETTTHLVMTAIQLSPKVANCLANCVPIVTPEYFRDFLACVKSKQRLPDADDYVPAVSSSESENMLRNPGVNLRRNLNRKTLFKGKLFLFVAEAQRTEMDLPITLCGGNTQVWNQEQDMNMLDSDDNLLVRPKSGKTQEIGQGFSSILVYLERKGRIAVPATGIYLAIVHCNFNKCSNVRSSSQVLPPKGFNQSLRSQVLAPESLQPVSGLNTSTPSLGTLGDSRTRGSATPSSVSTNKTSAPTNHISQYPSSLSKSVQDPSYLSKPVQNPSFVNSVSSSTSGSGLSINKVPEYSSAKDKDNSENSVRSLRTYTLTEHSPASMDTVKFQVEVSEVPKVVSNICSPKQERKRPLSSGEDAFQPAVKKPALQPSPGKPEPSVQDQPGFDDEDDDMFACPADNGGNQKPASLIQKSPQKSSSKEKDDNIFGFGETALRTQRQQIVPETQTINRKRKAPGPEENLFGFGESSLLSKKKAATSKNEDDIFGFGSPEKPKRKDEISQASKPSDKTEMKPRIGPAESKPKISDLDSSFGNTTTTSWNSTQSTSRPSHNTTGFLGKRFDGVKKEEGVENLTKSFGRIVYVNLYRKTPFKPRVVDEVASPSGKPVLNFKTFKKQLIVKSCQKVKLAPYKASRDETRLDEWMQNNSLIYQTMHDKEKEKESTEDFWNFQSQPQAGNRSTGPTSRGRRR